MAAVAAVDGGPLLPSVAVVTDGRRRSGELCVPVDAVAAAGDEDEKTLEPMLPTLPTPPLPPKTVERRLCAGRARNAAAAAAAGKCVQ